MNIFQKIAYSSTPTKVAWGICTGLVAITLAVGVINGVKIANNISKKSELESSYASLQNTYNSKLLEVSGNSESSVVDAELYSASNAGDIVAIWQHTLSTGAELSVEETVNVEQMMQGHMDRWLPIDNVEYQFLSDVNFSETTFPVVWSARTSDGTLLAYINATYNAQDNTFDDIHVNRTVFYDEVVNTTIAVETTPVVTIAPETSEASDETVETSDIVESQVYETSEVDNG